MIIITVGISNSGKSTWSQTIVRSRPDTIRINRDKLREMVFAYHPSRVKNYWKSGDINKKEGIITDLELANIETGIKIGQDVIIDNVNLNMSYIKRYKNIADKWKLDFKIKIFDVDPNLCIQRDKNRDRSVGAEYIKKQHKQFLELLENKKFKEWQK